MSYIGQTLPADSFQGFTTDTFTGNGSATTFTLSKTPFSEDSLIVVIDNVIQQPTTNFTVSGTTLTIVGTAILSGITGYAIHTGGPLPIGGASELDLNGASDKLILDADADTTISADTDDQIDFKAGGTDIMSLTATTATINDGVTISVADNTDTLTLKSTDTDASVGPVLLFNRDSSSPAANDFLGTIDFQGKNSAGDAHDYIRILSRILSTTDGSETADLVFKDATGNNILNMAASEVVFNDDSVSRDFRVESNDAQKAFFVNSAYAHAHLSGTSAGSSTKVSYYSGGMGSIQLGVGGTIASYDYGVVDGPYIWHNIYADGANGKKYVGAGEAATYGMYDGIHLFYTSASGSGDASVTQNERFRIANNGDLTATDTSIGSNSDQRLKKDIVDHTYDINKFKAFKPKSFAWIHPEAHTNEATTGFVAQEIESTDSDWAYSIPWDSHSPDDKGPKEDEEKALCNDEPKKASKLGKKDAMYISVIQQLITRIEALEDA